MKKEFLRSSFVAENLRFITVWHDVFCFPDAKISNQYSGCFNIGEAGHHRSRIIKKCDLESYNYRRYLSWFVLFALIFGILLPSAGYAHRGAIDEVDPCRIKVGNEWVHFTAYTPMLTGGKGHCKAIPQAGLTNLVFDYEGQQLRHVTVEFEITKEPEGTRIYYQEPQKILSGTVKV